MSDGSQKGEVVHPRPQMACSSLMVTHIETLCQKFNFKFNNFFDKEFDKMKTTTLLLLVAGCGIPSALGRDILGNRLPAPCAVPDSYYPYKTCRITNNAGDCGKGYNAYATLAECCAPNSGAFGPDGCTKAVNDGCWVAGSFYPKKKCEKITDVGKCSLDWGHWATYDECCAPGGAFPEGCSKPDPCYYGAQWYPERKCQKTEDQSICQRGWGAYKDEASCCQPGAAFGQGCGPAN